MRYLGLFNQSERGAPAVGPRDVALRNGRTAADPRRSGSRNNFPSAATMLFRGLYGAVAVRPAMNVFVATNGGYGGVFPMDEQPLLSKPKPWQDPTLGKP
jgi:hypothetical protein